MGYKGFVQLAMRSGQFKTINVTDVREGELRGVNRLTGELDIEWINEDREKLKVVGYIAHMKLINGFEKSLYMTEKQLRQHGNKYSQSMRRGYGLWKDDFDSMAKKTVLKLLLSKYAPLSTEMVKAVEADQAAISKEGIKYIDNQEDTPDEVAAAKERERIIGHIEKSETIKELEKCEEYIVDDEVRDMYESKKQLINKKQKRS